MQPTEYKNISIQEDKKDPWKCKPAGKSYLVLVQGMSSCMHSYIYYSHDIPFSLHGYCRLISKKIKQPQMDKTSVTLKNHPKLIRLTKQSLTYRLLIITGITDYELSGILWILLH